MTVEEKKRPTRPLEQRLGARDWMKGGFSVIIKSGEGIFSSLSVFLVNRDTDCMRL
jgi:hypothetical protein